ncbi:ABC1 kinase family protein [Ningiella sp. W23]|uniref:ABC1 kinase family protein n=1 Tax=Ningiella sp. W23 TaxID=3023715 RepID=UPI00375676EB
MSNNKPSSKVPASRLSRFAKLGGLASGIAARAIASSAGELMQARRPNVKSTLLNSANATAISKSLSEMRGAAMKVGQMLSMDAGEFLPQQWEPILAALRQGADTMPKAQLLDTLNEQWGSDWSKHFEYFSFDPIASASIGQVHRARLKKHIADDAGDKFTPIDAQLAIKVQYPGVAKSIDSDIRNVGRLLRLSGVVPSNFDLESLLSQAAEQLKNEADYESEARYIESYRKLIEVLQTAQHTSTTQYADLPRLLAPDVYRPLSSDKVLCMSFVKGETIDTLVNYDIETKSRVVTQLFSLMLEELFHSQLIQSDPNFANYLYDADSDTIAVLDFGACRSLENSISNAYKNIAHAMLDQDTGAIHKALKELGLVYEKMPDSITNTIINACLIASECLQTDSYNFKASALIQRLFDATKVLTENRKEIEPPNFDVALVNRKVSGMVLLANKLQCSIPLRALVMSALKKGT